MGITSDLIYSKTGGIATIMFNRPSRLNALGANTTMELVRTFEDAASDPTIRVIVLTGQGRAFCVGGDYKDNFLAGLDKTTIERRSRIRNGVNRFIKSAVECEKPVIASINGLAVGGGATIALACDIRIASENARFRFPFAGIGLTPEFGCSYFLPRLLGIGKAFEILFTADFIEAGEAFRIGLVNRLVTPNDLQKSTDEFAQMLAQKPSSAVGITKTLVYRSLSNDLVSQLELEAFAISTSFQTEEHKTAVAAFLNKKA